MNSIHQLPFDQYQRYRLVADLIEELSGAQDFSILDVGGRTALLREFLPNQRITLVDVDPSDAQGLILGSGAALPFGDASFDVVCAFDTLEHVPVDLRDGFVRECARVSKGYVMLAGPYQSPEVQRSEELLQAFLENKVGEPHRYLNEHRELGLPDRQRVQTLLEEAGAAVATFGHGRLDRWLLAMCLELYLESDPLLQPLGKPFYEFYNRLVYPHDHGERNYRHVVVAAMADRPLPRGEALLQAPELPVETEGVLAQYAQNILQLDAQRTVFEPERQRLVGIIADLEKDLREHTQALTTAEADLAQHKQSLQTTQQDLREHQTTLQVTRQDLEAHQATLQAVEAERQKQGQAIEAMVAELRGEQAKLQDYVASLEARVRELDGECEALRNHRDELVPELDKTHRLAGRLNAQIVEQQEHTQALTTQFEAIEADLKQRVEDLQGLADQAQADLRAQHAEIAHWQGLTSSRWKLLRAALLRTPQPPAQPPAQPPFEPPPEPPPHSAS